MSQEVVVLVGNWQRGSCPTGVIVLWGSCPWGSCLQGSCSWVVLGVVVLEPGPQVKGPVHPQDPRTIGL